jgi:hypothetical protein
MNMLTRSKAPRGPWQTALALSFLPALLACESRSTSAPCTTNSECVGEQVCRLGVCRPATSDAPEDAGTLIDAGTLSPRGAACTSNAQCASGFCADGVCCDNACNQGCGTCKSAGAVGTCTPKPKGAECGAYRCNEGSVSCPTSCVNSLDCTNAYGCCDPLKLDSNECRVLGQTSTCTLFKPCSKLIDTFDGETVNTALWTTAISDPQTGKVDQLNGKLRLSTGISAVGSDQKDRFAELNAARRCSMVNDTVTFSLGDISQTTGTSETNGFAIASLNIESPVSNSGIEVGVQYGTEVVAYYTLAADGGLGQTVARPTYDPRVMRSFSMSEDGGFVTFGFSSNGKDFTPFERVPAVGHLGDVTFQLRLYTYNGPADAGTIIFFDDVNVTP